MPWDVYCACTVSRATVGLRISSTLVTCGKANGSRVSEVRAETSAQLLTSARTHAQPTTSAPYQSKRRRNRRAHTNDHDGWKSVQCRKSDAAPAAMQVDGGVGTQTARAPQHVADQRDVSGERRGCQHRSETCMQHERPRGPRVGREQWRPSFSTHSAVRNRSAWTAKTTKVGPLGPNQNSCSCLFLGTHTPRLPTHRRGRQAQLPFVRSMCVS